MTISQDLVTGQLLSQATPGLELCRICEDLAELAGTESSKPGKQMKDIFEKRFVNVKSDGTSIRVSKFNQLEVESDAVGTYAEDTVCGYYSSPEGDVYGVHYGSGFSVESVGQMGDDTVPVAQTGLYSRMKEFLGTSSNPSLFTLFETDKPSACILVNGITECMEVNCWSVHCAGVWTVTTNSENIQYTVSGEVSVDVHFFENCNFRLSGSKWKVKPIGPVSSLEDAILAIKKKILKFKNKIHNKIYIHEISPPGDSVTPQRQQSSAGSSAVASAVVPKDATAPSVLQTTLVKKLRRPLPYHKTKFDWNINRVLLLQQIQ